MSEVGIYEAARLSGRSPARLKELIYSGKLQARKVDRKWVIRVEDLEGLNGVKETERKNVADKRGERKKRVESIAVEAERATAVDPVDEVEEAEDGGTGEGAGVPELVSDVRADGGREFAADRAAERVVSGLCRTCKHYKGNHRLEGGGPCMIKKCVCKRWRK